MKTWHWPTNFHYFAAAEAAVDLATTTVMGTGHDDCVVTEEFFSYWAFSLGDLTGLGGTLLPEEVNVYGDGSVMGALTSVPDVTKVTVRAVNDTRMQDKEIRITANPITQNLLIALWQTTSGRTVERIGVPAAELEKIIASSTAPDQGMTLVASQLHRSVWIRGDSVKRAATSLEATEVYPDMAFQTIEPGLAQLV